jgi:predicted dehydrogenase
MKIACLGTGTFGLNHLRVVREDFPDIEIVALYDPHEPNRDAASQFAPSARVCTSQAELIASDAEGVIISTPGFMHHDHAAACLMGGKHVLLEKPVMTTREGCRQVVEAAENHPDRVLLINHELRYADYFRNIKALIDSDAVGEPQLVWCKSFRPPFLKKVGNWIQDSRQSGGVMVDMNSHHFDLMNWWIGSRPKRVAGFGGNDVVRVVNNEHEVLDHASVSFEYENGVRGGLMLCMFAPPTGEDLEMGVIGSGGMLQTKMSRWEIHQWNRGAEKTDPIVHHVPPARDTRGTPIGFVEVHDEFVKCVREGRRPLTDVRACVDGSLLAIAAEEAIKTGTVVEV